MLLTDQGWAAIKATLPGDVDETWFRSELGRIAGDMMPPRERQKHCLDRARICAAFAQILPKLEYVHADAALLEQLKEQEREERRRARIFGRIAAEHRPRKFLKQWELLWLWERAGGSLFITTPRKKKDDAKNPPPRGAVIRYLEAAMKPLWGKAPGPHQIKLIVWKYRRFRPIGAAMVGAGGLAASATMIHLVDKV